MSSDETVVNVTMSEKNELIVSKMNGDSNVVLTVDKTLKSDSSNPVENKTIYTKFESQDADIVNNVKTPLNTLIGSDNGKSVRDISIDVLTEQLVPETAQESLDTLKEIADWIQKHPENAAAMNEAIAENTLEIIRVDNKFQDVLELPTEYINPNTTYRVLEGNFYLNGLLRNDFICNVVSWDKVPNTAGENALNLTDSGYQITGYYNVKDNIIYGYLDKAVFQNQVNNSTVLSSAEKLAINGVLIFMSSGWKTLESMLDLASMVSTIKYGGIVINKKAMSAKDTVYLLLTYNCYLYRNNNWIKLNANSFIEGEGANAEIFNSSVNIASGKGSHAQGIYTQAIGDYSHAEGKGTKAIGLQSHSEGHNTQTVGNTSHAEGHQGSAFGYASHIEGNSTNPLPNGITIDSTNEEVIAAWESTKFSMTNGAGAHVEGGDNLALENYTHAEGYQNIAIAQSAHVEGGENQATGVRSHAEGYNNKALAHASHTEGQGNENNGNSAHVEGYQNILNDTAKWAHGEGRGNQLDGEGSHAEGGFNIVSGHFAHVEGSNIKNNTTGTKRDSFDVTYRDASYTEGSDQTITIDKNLAQGHSSHVEGVQNAALGYGSHAEGLKNLVTSEAGHVEGTANIVSGNYAHAEGRENVAGLHTAHVEGYKNKALGSNSHAEGQNTVASASRAHSEGYGTIAASANQHAQGKWNIADTSNQYAHIVGGGSGEDELNEDGSIKKQNRKNIHTLDWNGNAHFLGNVYSNNIKLVNNTEFNNEISSLNTKIGNNTTNITNLTTQVNTNKSNISSLTTQVNTNKSNISSLNSTVSSHTSSISTLNTKVNNLENKVPTNVVDLSSAQTVSGVKTFSNGIKIGSATIKYDSNKLVISF